MPEIAEVRTVASTLNRQLVGRKIIDIEMPYSRIIEGDPLEFKNALLNRVLRELITLVSGCSFIWTI